MSYTTNKPQQKFTLADFDKRLQAVLISYQLELEYWQKIMEIAPAFDGQKINKRMRDKFHAAVGEKIKLTEGRVMWELEVTDARLFHRKRKFSVCYPEHGIFSVEQLKYHNGCIASMQRDVAEMQANLTATQRLFQEHGEILARITAFNERLGSSYGLAPLRISAQETTLEEYS